MPIIGDMDARVMLEVKPSNIPNADDGLYAKCHIPKHTIFSIEHSRGRANPIARNGFDVLDYYVDEDHDPQSICVVDGNVRMMSELPKSNPVKKMYVHAPRNQFMMKANDFGWDDSNTDLSIREYETLAQKNKLVLVASLSSKGVLNGTCGIALCDIHKGEEIGMTYGLSYWLDDE